MFMMFMMFGFYFEIISGIVLNTFCYFTLHLLAWFSRRLSHCLLWPLGALLTGTSDDRAVADENCGKCMFMQSLAAG